MDGMSKFGKVAVLLGGRSAERKLNRSFRWSRSWQRDEAHLNLSVCLGAPALE
jgi:hypothetical protein